ncbi:MAG: hypothetical protein P1V20_28350 [Verrucomicrobiales bacterium]|nr:hypothetical protein [Verrucomicrobiales bacterium]
MISKLERAYPESHPVSLRNEVQLFRGYLEGVALGLNRSGTNLLYDLYRNLPVDPLGDFGKFERGFSQVLAGSGLLCASSDLSEFGYSKSALPELSFDSESVGSDSLHVSLSESMPQQISWLLSRLEEAYPETHPVSLRNEVQLFRGYLEGVQTGWNKTGNNFMLKLYSDLPEDHLGTYGRLCKGYSLVLARSGVICERSDLSLYTNRRQESPGQWTSGIRDRDAAGISNSRTSFS